MIESEANSNFQYWIVQRTEEYRQSMQMQGMNKYSAELENKISEEAGSRQ